jgi:hypothetical protein
MKEHEVVVFDLNLSHLLGNPVVVIKKLLSLRVREFFQVLELICP